MGRGVSASSGALRIRRDESLVDAERKRRPALTPEARENQLIALAVDLAERQLLDGTASAQVITHYIRLVYYQVRIKR